MGRTSKKRKTKTRSQSETSPQTPSTNIIVAQPETYYPPEEYEKIKQITQPQPPAISDQLRDQLTGLMQELLLKTHELSFEYSTSECEEIRECPLAMQAKEMFKTIKKLHKLVRQVTPQATPSKKSGYVT